MSQSEWSFAHTKSVRISHMHALTDPSVAGSNRVILAQLYTLSTFSDSTNKNFIIILFIAWLTNVIMPFGKYDCVYHPKNITLEKH